MSDVASLLPPSASLAERAIEQAVGRISAVPVPLREIKDAATCHPEALPALAWERSVDEWHSAYSESEKRAAIADSYILHALKGTPWAVKRALQQVGFDVEIIDQAAQRAIYAPYLPLRIDGTWRLTPANRVRPIERLAAVPQIQHWAQFIARVNLADARDSDGLALARRLIDAWKPASRHQIFLLWLLLIADARAGMGVETALHARLPSTRMYPWCDASLSTYPDAVWRMGRDGEPPRLPQAFGAFRVGERLGSVPGRVLRGCRAPVTVSARLPVAEAALPRERLAPEPVPIVTPAARLIDRPRRIDGAWRLTHARFGRPFGFRLTHARFRQRQRFGAFRLGEHRALPPARLTVSGLWRLGQAIAPEIYVQRIAA